MTYQKELNLIKEVTKKIYDETIDKTLESKFKGLQDLVTSTDLHIEEELVGIIKKVFPNDHFHTEEFHNQTRLKDRTWIIDPIDGTSNYAVGLPLFVVQIAFYDQGDIVMSYLYAPKLNKTWHAVKGEGAYVNDKLYHTNDHSDSSMVMSLVGMTHDNEKMFYENMLDLAIKRKYKLRMLGSIGLELALASEGMFNFFYTNESKIWDLYPGLLLLRETGAIVLNEKGKPYELGDEHLFICKNDDAKVILEKQILSSS